MDRRGVSEGMVVATADGEKLGKVIQCSDDHFLIEKGFFFPTDYVASYNDVSRVSDGEVTLSRRRADFSDRPGEIAGAGTAPKAGSEMSEEREPPNP